MPEQKKRGGAPGLQGLAGKLIQSVKTPLAGAVFASLTLGVAIGAAANGYVSTVNGITTIQGQLSPPGQTTFIGASGSCDANLNAAAQAKQNALINGYAGNGLQSSFAACMSGLAGMSMFGLPSFNIAGLMSAISSQACMMATSAVMSATQPITNKINTYNPMTMGSQVGIPGTAVNLNSAMSYGPSVSPSMLNGSIFSTP